MAAMGRQESRPLGSESVLYLLTHLVSAAPLTCLKPPDFSSFSRSGFCMIVIQPKCDRTGSWEADSNMEISTQEVH